MSYHDYITLVSSLLGSGGLLGAVYLLMKFRPEAGSIVVKSAEGVLVMQSTYIKTLEQRISHLESENESLRLELKILRDKVDSFQGNQDRHDKEIKGFQGKQDKHSQDQDKHDKKVQGDQDRQDKNISDLQE